MFNLLRLFRRDDHIDDTASAYIEGRATEHDEAELRDRAVQEPGLFGDLDSIRDTVSLLRSVQPVEAPRSFVLAEAPVQVRVKRSRIAMAPAVFAIAAAAVVGLLAVGNLADVVRQNEGSSSDAVSESFSESTAARSSEPDTAQSESAIAAGGSAATEELTGDPGLPGPPGVSGDNAADSAAQSGTTTGAGSLAAATASPAASIAISPSLPTDGAADGTAGVTVGSDGATPPSSSDFETKSDDEDDISTGETLSPVAPGTDPSGNITGSGPDSDEERRTGITSDEPMPSPDSTATALLFDIQAQPVIEQSREALSPESGPDGVALPLWQFQLGFAVLAVLMAGAWMALQRRLTA